LPQIAVVNPLPDIQRWPQNGGLVQRFLKVHQASPEKDGCHVSLPFTIAAGIATIALSRAVRDQQARFAGAVAATLDPKFFDDALKVDEPSLGIEPVLIHQHGKVLDFIPQTSLIGKSVKGCIAFMDMKNQVNR
jgi:hypothetical protein